MSCMSYTTSRWHVLPLLNVMMVQPSIFAESLICSEKLSRDVVSTVHVNVFFYAWFEYSEIDALTRRRQKVSGNLEKALSTQGL